MIFRYAFFILSLSTITPAWAGLYSCDEKSEEPFYLSAVQSTELTYETTESTFLPFHQSDELYRNRKPYLIYYAIDSAEAFMQYSVRFEVAKLQESCLKSKKVNFVALLNSLYVENNEIIVCKDQKLKYLNLKEFPELNNLLFLKRNFISTGNHALNDNLGPLRYLVRYHEHSNESFGRYPLAHPDFLFDLVNLITTEESLFPSHKYLPFLNLKSHGSATKVLAGMHQCQEKAKELTANEALQSILTKDEIDFLNKKNIGPELNNDIDDYDKILSKLQLGTSQGRMIEENDLGENRLGENRLGFKKNGLGNILQGLGVSQGLGLDFSFGTAHIHLNWALSDLFDNDTDRILGFLMLESCDTNRDPKFFHSYLYNVLGFYSAKSSLWYRNLNWWTMLERADSSANNLLNIVKEETSNIPNIRSSPLQ